MKRIQTNPDPQHWLKYKDLFAANIYLGACQFLSVVLPVAFLSVLRNVDPFHFDTDPDLGTVS